MLETGSALLFDGEYGVSSSNRTHARATLRRRRRRRQQAGSPPPARACIAVPCCRGIVQGAAASSAYFPTQPAFGGAVAPYASQVYYPQPVPVAGGGQPMVAGQRSNNNAGYDGFH